MNRRSFLGTILAAAVAPAIVRADSLMRIVPRETLLFMDADIALARGACALLQYVIHGDVDIIKTTTILEQSAGVIFNHYGYHAENLELLLPQDVPNPTTLVLDGREMSMPEGTTVQCAPGSPRTLRIPRLDLTDYGNRIPQIEVIGGPSNAR